MSVNVFLLGYGNVKPRLNVGLTRPYSTLEREASNLAPFCDNEVFFNLKERRGKYTRPAASFQDIQVDKLEWYPNGPAELSGLLEKLNKKDHINIFIELSSLTMTGSTKLTL